MLKKIIQSSAYLSAGVFIAKLLAVSFTLILARLLGPERMGAFTLSLLLVSWFSIIALLSVQTVSTQIIAEYNAKGLDISKPVTAALFLGTITAILATVAHFLIADFVAVNVYNDASLAVYIKFASLIIIGTVLFHTAQGIERGMKNFVSYAALEISKQAIMLVIGLIFLLVFSWRIMGAIAAAIIAPGIIAIFAYLRYAKYFRYNFWSEVKQMFSLGLGITLMSTFITIFTSIDKFVLGALTTKELVGLYVPAITMVTFLGLFLSGSIKNAVFPYIVESYTKKEFKQARHYMKKIILYYTILLGFLLIPTMFFRSEGIAIAFGPEYKLAVEPLAIMLFGTVYYAMFIIMQGFVLGTNKVKEGIYATAASVVFAIITNIILISLYGLIGAAFALLFNTLFLAISYSIIIINSIGMKIKKIVISVLILNGILLLSYFLSDNSLLLRIIFSLLVIGLYCALLLLLKLLGKEEINFALIKLAEFRNIVFKSKI
ncbi:MAG: oligosaccharide flippase family protein [Nanoarchaeota archaeon]